MKKRIPLLLGVCLLAVFLLSECVAPAAHTENTAPVETTAAPTETVAAADTPDAVLRQMTLRQKVGQLFIVNLDALDPSQTQEQIFDPYAIGVTELSESMGRTLAQYPVGGMVALAKNLTSPDQVIRFSQALQSASAIPLFLCVDEEGGPVARFANQEAFGLPRYDSAAAVGASADPADALEMGRTIGSYLAEYGFHVDFAPVADVNTNPDNPVIGIRAFSDDPQIAAEMAAAFADGLAEHGIIATFKHFPGHGDTAEDSHSGLAVVYKTMDELENCEFLPFLEADARDMVMVAHVALPNVTGNMTPATLSREIVTEILREKLGFEGLVITDAMNMGAIADSYGCAEATVAALQAGCDIILMPQSLPEAFNAVLAALEDGSLSMQWLDETVYRILVFKQLHGIL